MENDILDYKETSFSAEQIAAEQQRFMTRVFGWMTGALLITAIVAMLTAQNPFLLNLILGNKFMFYGLLIGELGLVLGISALINKISANVATLLFIIYSIFNGLTFSMIFLVYSSSSIASTFFITAGIFGVMAFYGYVTKKDLTSMGSLLMMALFGLIIATVVNLFMHSEMLYWLTSFAGVIIFVGLTAYDTQKVKNMNIVGNEGTDEDRKESIMGALILYLDFINLFLYLLRFFGRRD